MFWGTDKFSENRPTPPDLVRLACVMMGLAALAAPARAQTVSADPASRAAAWSRLGANPSDYAATFAYVREAEAARDYEPAIVALERLLFFNPGLVRAKVELGVLYFRLKSYAMAARYFEEARASGGLDADMTQRVDAYLPMARKELQADRFYGLLETGVRFNSNPATLPSQSLLASSGLVVPGGAKYVGQGDTAAFVLGDLRYVHDFQNERGDVFEARIQGYATAQFRFPEFNVGLLDIVVGPRLALAPEALPGVTIHPYGALTATSLNGSLYSSTGGGGVSLGVPLSPWFSLEPGIEWRSISVRDPNAPTSSAVLNAGSLTTGSIAAHWAALDRVTIDARAFIASNPASNAVLSSSQNGVEASIRFDVDPLVAGPLLWSVTPFARYASVSFDRINPALSAVAARREAQWRAGAQLDMPINGWLGLTTVAQYMQNDSNFAQFRSSAWSVALGATVRY
jgi:hypothetical protein